MENFITFSIAVFTRFFVLMNTISNIPVFLTVVEGDNKKTKQRVNKKAVFIAFNIV